MKKWVFLSPHFDDVVLSVGGLVWELTRQGDKVEIWTICAGDPPYDKPMTDYGEMMQYVWDIGDDVPFKRSKEDAACCQVLGASYRRYTVPDNIYRYYQGTDDPVCKIPEDNFGPLEPAEAYLIPGVADFLKKNLPEDCEVVIPLTVGNHRDHVLTRKAAERLHRPLWHFIDYPYAILNDFNPVDWIPESAEKFMVEISHHGLSAWQAGFACQRSQIILFWPDEEQMRQSIEEYHKAGQGFTLYKF